MSNYTSEQLEAAKAAKTPDELIALAKENGVEITREQAERFIALTAEPSAAAPADKGTQALSDEELENVAGGYCKDSQGREIVTLITLCVHGIWRKTTLCGDEVWDTKYCPYLTYEGGMWYCNYNIRPRN